jgi:hypothetical protein
MKTYRVTHCPHHIPLLTKCLQCEIDFLRRNFKHALKLKDRAEVALRDIRDGKDNPCYLAEQVVGKTQWRPPPSSQ